MRIMARRMMSAAAPWIGALMAARSMKARSEALGEVMRGKWQRRPKIVST